MASNHRVAAAALLLAGCVDMGPKPSVQMAELETIAAGKAFAQEACSACHQVSPDAPEPPPVFNSVEHEYVTAPSFMAIAGDPSIDAGYLRSTILAPPHPMKEQMVSTDNLDAVIAYILSL